MPYSNKEKAKERKHKWYLEHQKEAKERSRNWRIAHKEEMKKWQQEYNRSHREKRINHYKEQRLTVIKHYGGKCAFCGDTNINHLCIDHINDDGAKHRKTTDGRKFLNRLIKSNFPDGFQILCWNHNAEKQYAKIMTPDTFD